MKANFIGYLAVSVCTALLVVCAIAVPGMKAIYIGYLAASVCISLPFIYWGTAPDWWKLRAGRALMMLLGSLAALFLLIMTSSLFGAYEYREIVRYVIYGSVLVAGVRLAILFLQLRIGADWAKRNEERR